MKVVRTFLIMVVLAVGLAIGPSGTHRALADIGGCANCDNAMVALQPPSAGAIPF